MSSVDTRLTMLSKYAVFLGYSIAKGRGTNLISLPFISWRIMTSCFDKLCPKVYK